MGDYKPDWKQIVPATTGHRLHMAGTFVDGAVDIYAPPESTVRAPADGWVESVMYLRFPLFGYEIRGYVEDRQKRLMGFVAAHLLNDSFPLPGDNFVKGEVVGQVAYWPASPAFSHVHFAFRVGDAPLPRPKMPPPGNIRVVRAFRRLGI